MDFKEGDKVNVKIIEQTALGYSVLIENKWHGLIYENEVFQALEEDMEVIGYIKKVREDGKIDVSLQPQGFKNAIDADEQKILSKLKSTKEGKIAITDKSSPEAIKFHFQMSKKAFKRAIGGLYKKRLIVLENDIIILKS